MEMQDRVILAIDLKSFYASVECADRGLDPLTTHLAVADESRTGKNNLSGNLSFRKNSVLLAVRAYSRSIRKSQRSTISGVFRHHKESWSIPLGMRKH